MTWRAISAAALPEAMRDDFLQLLERPLRRGLHLSTFQLNLRRF
jgi:hypothetical protein